MKKVSEVLRPADLNPPLVKFFICVSPVMSILTIGAGVVNPPVLSNEWPPFQEKPLPVASAGTEKVEWLIVGKTRSKLYITGSHSPEAPQVKTRTVTQPLPVTSALTRLSTPSS